MRAFLVQQKVAKAIDESDDKLVQMSDAEFFDMKEIAYSTTIPYLPNNALRQVNDQSTANEGMG